VAKLQRAVQEMKAAASREKSVGCKMCQRFDAELRHLQDENHGLNTALQAAEQKISSSAQDVSLLQARLVDIHTYRD